TLSPCSERALRSARSSSDQSFPEFRSGPSRPSKLPPLCLARAAINPPIARARCTSCRLPFKAQLLRLLRDVVERTRPTEKFGRPLERPPAGGVIAQISNVCFAPWSAVVDVVHGAFHATTDGAGGFLGPRVTIFITSRSDSFRPISSGGTPSTRV